MYTATQLAEKLDISRAYLYYLKKTGAVYVPQNHQGKSEWTDEVYIKLAQYLQKKRSIANQEVPKHDKIKTFSINNRRYLGNKYKLLPFIRRVVAEECHDIDVVADIFAGTGVVASAFLDKKIITNDILYSNYICHIAWFSDEQYSEEKIINYINIYNAMDVAEDNYMSENYADTYFSVADCRKIGYIREDIEKNYQSGNLNGRERALLITSLLYAMDKIANTCGHYDAYRKNAAFDRHLVLLLPKTEKATSQNNMFFNADINEVIENIEADLVYIDPPYNSRQYSDTYHLLENVARWEKPPVFGVAKKMDRSHIKSAYCTRKANEAFEDLVDKIKAKYILLSYNNMGKKGDDRSNARISDAEIMRILSKKGKVKVFAEDYKLFSAGSTEIDDNKERLFLCICNNERKCIASPLNYTGGKYKLLPQIIPYFPSSMDKAVDLFCGGCNVGINLPCTKVTFNDCNDKLIGIFRMLKSLPKEEIMTGIHRFINEYGLSRVCDYGYDYYGCDSSQGLGKYNKEGFLRLRRDFNALSAFDETYYLMLYVLIVYSFNNQLRFNSKGKFNLPVGKRDFNEKMQSKLSDFIVRIQSNDYVFTDNDFREVSLDEYTEQSFFYIDPPYLITCAGYNEGNGWTDKDEYDLLAFMDELHRRHIKFALSNVLESNGRTNSILGKWLTERPYRVIDLQYSYANSNYHKKSRKDTTREILVVNY